VQKALLVVASLVLAGAAAAPIFGQEEGEFDRFGGWAETQLAATGWFRTAQAHGRWWLIDPEGHPFFTVGVNTVSFRQDTIQGTNQSPYGEAVAAKYGPPAEWAAAAVGRLREWGFNTIGAWSDRITWRQGIPYTVILNVSDAGPRPEGMSLPDVFDPSYAEAVIGVVRRICRPLAQDEHLVGYFTDNELRWGADWRSGDPIFVEFLQLPDDAPGRRAVVNFLESRYLTVGELNEEWRTEYESFDQIGRTPQVGSRIPAEDQDGFLQLVAQQYFRIAEDAVRGVDEHHLILGCRFAGYAPRPVLEAMRDHVDVVSLNHYATEPPKELLREIHRVTGRPVLISEFSFRARDSGLPNTRGAGVVVDTQEERAEHFERYVRELMALPMTVGYHWFEHADQPAAGRFDGEDSNYGVVDITDLPYTTLVETMSRVNRSFYR